MHRSESSADLAGRSGFGATCFNTWKRHLEIPVDRLRTFEERSKQGLTPV